MIFQLLISEIISLRFHLHQPQIPDHHLQGQQKVEEAVVLVKNNPPEKSLLQT